jgi:hypothetical protein
MYKEFNIIAIDGKEQKHIIQDRGNNEFTSFPADENNPNYQAYLKWVSEGNTPEPADTPNS